MWHKRKHTQQTIKTWKDKVEKKGSYKQWRFNGQIILRIHVLWSFDVKACNMHVLMPDFKINDLLYRGLNVLPLSLSQFDNQVWPMLMTLIQTIWETKIKAKYYIVLKQDVPYSSTCTMFTTNNNHHYEQVHTIQQSHTTHTILTGLISEFFISFEN